MKRIISALLAVFMLAAAVGSGALIVSANEEEASSLGKPVVVLDYVQETIWIDYTNPNGRMLPDDLTLNKNVVLMYALKIKGTEDKDLEKAKWLPTYSGEINISKYVPKKAGGKEYMIAFRWSDQSPKKENIAVVTLKPRQTITKGDVWYDADKQHVIANGKGFEVKIGDDVWYENEIGWGALIGDYTGADDSVPDKDRPLFLPMNFMPTGGVVTARKSTVAEDEGIEGQFASPVLKIKMPKLPKPPKAVEASKITIVPKGGKVSAAYFKGVSEKMEIFVREKESEDGQTTEEWKALKKNMSVADFDKLFEESASGKDSSRAAGKYSFRVRNRATGNKPASPETVLEFDQTAYGEALSANDNGGEEN